MSIFSAIFGQDDQRSSHVLVVGSSHAGMCAAETLLRSRAPIAVTLISADLDFEFVPSALYRHLIPSPVHAVASPLLGRTFGFVQGTVISLSRNVARVNMVRRRQHKTAFLESPKSYIEFDYCVWAVGDIYPALPDRFPSFFFPGDRAVIPLRDQVRVCTARSILVIGGGVAGVETAAELAATLPRCRKSERGSATPRKTSSSSPSLSSPCDIKSPSGVPSTSANQNSATSRVTLATTDVLLPRLPARAQEYAYEWLKVHGVALVSARVSASCSSPVRSGDSAAGARLFDCESGPASLSADLAIRCTRARTVGTSAPTLNDANDDTTEAHSGSGWRALAAGGVCADQDITARGSVEVRPTLQLRRTANILVAGDIALVPGELDRNGAFAEKTVYASMAGGRLAARNVIALDAAVRRADRSPLLECYPDDAFPLGIFPRLFAVSLHDADGCLCVGPLVITGRVATFSKRVSALLGAAAVSGFRPFELFFAMCARTIFFVTAVVQVVFGYAHE